MKDGKYNGLRWSQIIGYVDHVDAVHSQCFHMDDPEYGQSHYDLFGINLNAWRWNFDKGIDCFMERLSTEHSERVKQHLFDEYGIRFWDNGYHDLTFFIKQMDKENLKLKKSNGEKSITKRKRAVRRHS